MPLILTFLNQRTCNLDSIFVILTLRHHFFPPWRYAKRIKLLTPPMIHSARAIIGPGSSDHYSHLKFVLFSRFWKAKDRWKDGRTHNTGENGEHYRPGRPRGSIKLLTPPPVMHATKKTCEIVDRVIEAFFRVKYSLGFVFLEVISKQVEKG